MTRRTDPGTAQPHFSLSERQKEATGEPFTFEAGGQIFTMRSPTEVNWQTAFELGSGNGDLRKYLEELLGDDYERFCAVKGITAGDINALIEAATRHYQGVGRGE